MSWTFTGIFALRALAVGLESGRVHACRCHARAELHDAHFDLERNSTLLSDPTLVEVTPLLAGLLQHLEQPRLAPVVRRHRSPDGGGSLEREGGVA